MVVSTKRAPDSRDPNLCSEENYLAQCVVVFQFPDGDFLTACHLHSFECSQAAWEEGAIHWKVDRKAKQPVVLACPGCDQPVLVDPKSGKFTHPPEAGQELH